MGDPLARRAWESLPGAWQLAFEEAWASFCDGSLGIGASLVDPVTGEVVAVGRNRVRDANEQPRTLTGNFMAHAEMNAFAAMGRFKADGLDLYTTLQPCLMCGATSVFLHVQRVFYAARDEFFEGVDELWDQHPYAQRWKPEQCGPLDAPMASFARVLPLSVEAGRSPESSVLAMARDRTPVIAALAAELASDGTLDEVRDSGGRVDDAVAVLWHRLPSGL